MASDRNEVTLRDLLYELAIDADTSKALRRLMGEHPEHAEELAQYAGDMAADDDTEQEIEDADEDRINQIASPAMSRYQNRLYDQKHGSEPSAPAAMQTEAPNTADPFAALTVKEFRALAVGLGVNSLLLTKVRDRVVKADTIPERFSERTAAALGIPHPAFIAQLAQPPRPPPGLRWRAEEKPRAGPQQTWEEAVRSSSLTEAQQERLLRP